MSVQKFKFEFWRIKTVSKESKKIDFTETIYSSLLDEKTILSCKSKTVFRKEQYVLNYVQEWTLKGATVWVKVVAVQTVDKVGYLLCEITNGL